MGAIEDHRITTKVAGHEADAASVIVDNLDIWTSAIKHKSSAGRGGGSKRELYGIKKLRELILELAVRGLLVPQDPNDEPASELLKKIAAEKARMVKEGKIKKQKKLPPIQKDDIPFLVRKGWEWCRLQDISKYIQRGKGPKYSNQGRVRVVSQKCIQWTGFDLGPARFVDDSSLNSYQDERYLINKDLLWNSTGTGTVGRINVLHNIEEGTLVADSHVTVIRTLLVNTSFLWVYIAAPGVQSRIEPTHENALVSGTTKQVELNTSAVQSLIVPIPPLAEQQRIVAKVDELMALCDQLEQQTEASLTANESLVEALLGALTNAAEHDSFQQTWQRIAQHFDTLFTTEHSIEQLKQTILQLAVIGKLVPQDPNDESANELLKKITAERARLAKEAKIRKRKPLSKFEGCDSLLTNLPSNWEWARLNDVADIVRGGSPRPAGDPRFYNGNIPFLKVADITRSKSKFISGYEFTIKEAGLKKTRYIDQRTVLLTNSGATLGIPAICDFPATFNDGVAAFIELSRHVCDEYLFIYLKCLSKWFLDIASRGQGQPNLNTDIIKATWFALPPTNEQIRIVERVDELLTLCDQLKARLNEAQTTQLQLADAIAEQAIA